VEKARMRKTYTLRGKLNEEEKERRKGTWSLDTAKLQKRKFIRRLFRFSPLFHTKQGAFPSLNHEKPKREGAETKEKFEAALISINLKRKTEGGRTKDFILCKV
jgi:hypothetical protein